MPGVSDVDLLYENGILEGKRFELEVAMEKATDQQIGVVASEIDRLRSDDFAKFDQRVEISVAHRGMLSARASMPDDAARVAGLVRRVHGELGGARVFWSEDGSGKSSVKIDDAAMPGAAVDAVLQAFAERPLDDIEVTPRDRTAQPNWMVFGRLSVADKERLDRQLAAAAPAEPGWIGVSNGRINQLTFGLPSTATAYDDVVRVIRALEAGPEHPVRLTWRWNGDTARGDQPSWFGTAVIGKCENRDGPPGSLLPEAEALQKRIRAEFSGC